MFEGDDSIWPARMLPCTETVLLYTQDFPCQSRQSSSAIRLISQLSREHGMMQRRNMQTTNVGVCVHD